MIRQQPTTSGTWARTARKTYRHESGIVVRYNDNRWSWEIVGGAHDGERYGTLSVAQWVVVDALAGGAR